MAFRKINDINQGQHLYYSLDATSSQTLGGATEHLGAIIRGGTADQTISRSIIKRSGTCNIYLIYHWVANSAADDVYVRLREYTMAYGLVQSFVNGIDVAFTGGNVDVPIRMLLFAGAVVTAGNYIDAYIVGRAGTPIGVYIENIQVEWTA